MLVLPGLDSFFTARRAERMFLTEAKNLLNINVIEEPFDSEFRTAKMPKIHNLGTRSSLHDN